MRIVTRSVWAARSPKTHPTPVPLSARTASCVHHDGSTPITVRTFAQACELVRKDQNFHMDGRGWNDLGYNYLVISAPGFPDIDGLIFEGRGRDVLGAHCQGWNLPWVGIQVAVGGDQQPSPAALASVRWLHDTIATAAGRALGKKVHSDGFPTECPGTILRTWVDAGMPVPTKPAAQGTAKPVTNLRKAPTMWLIRTNTDAKIWKTNGFTKKWAGGAAELADLLKMCGQVSPLIVSQATLDAMTEVA